MLRPFLLVGVGGSGGKTLRAVRESLELSLKAAGWDEGIPEAWQFLHFDTPVKQDGADFPAKFLPHESYKGLVASSANYKNVVSSIKSRVNKDLGLEVERQLPDASEVTVTIVDGAGQYRAVGRTIALSKLDEIANSAEQALSKMRRPDSLQILTRLGVKLGADSMSGTTDIPVVVFVSSISGGSGAGQYLDVVEAVKSKFSATAWARESYGILYAPDVFDGISGGSGIASNALSTVNETVNGHWNRTPNASTTELFRAKGLTLLSGDANDRIGVRYPFVVGRQGATTSFAGQTDVYKAISTTITAWMTDDLFQDNIATYSKGNWTQNVSRAALPENSGLIQDEMKAPPLSAIGFGRVTLGKEKFISYSSERFARSVIERLLNAHKEGRKLDEGGDEDLWVRENAQKALVPFIENSGLNEDTEDHNQVIDALRTTTEVQALKLEFKSMVMNKAGDPASLDKNGGLTPDTWSSRLIGLRADSIKGYLERDRKNRQDALEKWVVSAPQHLLKLVSSYAVTHGLPVTAALIGHLQQSIARASIQLKAEALSFEAYASNIASYVYQDIQSAGAATSINADNDAVRQASERVAESLIWESEKELRNCASKLLDEVNRDLVGPLKAHLESLRKALEIRVQADETQDGRKNDYPFWPKIDSKEVARKYFPSSNEKMLLEPTEFAEKFNQLIRETYIDQVNDMDAALTAVREMSSELEDLPLISIVRTWKPSTQADPNTLASAPQSPDFNSYPYPEDYLARAELWMNRPGKPFKAFFNQTLTDYLSKKDIGPAEFNERKDRFLGHLKAAFNAASPLVKLHPGLLNEVHGKSIGEGDSIVVSSIPFNTQSDMYEPTLQVLIAEMSRFKLAPGVAAKDVVAKWFRDQNAHSIEFFTMLGFPVQPIVMQSIMEPVATAWNQKNSNAQSRSAFMRWSRGRLLRESVPMDTMAFEMAIKGWYVASALNLLAEELNEGLGPKISIRQKTSNDYLTFPHPLLYAGRLYENDYLAAVLESVSIAQALCTSQGNLKPLEPYKRLIGLAGEGKDLAPELYHWLSTGEALAPGQEPSAFATSSPEEVSSRIAKVQVFLSEEMKNFRTSADSSSSSSSVYSYPVSWEIREDVDRALRELIDQVGEFKPRSQGASLGSRGVL
jgi:hypothetical protein